VKQIKDIRLRGQCLLSQVLSASSAVVDFVAIHPYPVYGWDFLDYSAGRAPNLQVSNSLLAIMMKDHVRGLPAFLRSVLETYQLGVLT